MHHTTPSRQLDETLDILPNLDDAPVLAKTNIFYFVGGTGEKNVAYSHGVRQTVWALFHDRPGVLQDLLVADMYQLHAVFARYAVLLSVIMQAAYCHW